MKLRLEEGLPVSLLSRKTGCGKYVFCHWVKTYQERGEARLQDWIVSAGGRRKLPGLVREKIVEIKKHEPLFGVKRISRLFSTSQYQCSTHSSRNAL